LSDPCTTREVVGALGGIRSRGSAILISRVDGVTGHHPGPLNDQGVFRQRASEPSGDTLNVLGLAHVSTDTRHRVAEWLGEYSLAAHRSLNGDEAKFVSCATNDFGLSSEI
jgi:hypothetical protein